MGVYLLKSSAILVIFWLLYVLFLEKENMHHFKRFYLLISVFSAFIIPLLSIEQYVYVDPNNSLSFSNDITPLVFDKSSEINKAPFWTLERILWLVYVLGVALFSSRFIKNLFDIVKTINTNEKQKQSSITFVLLKSLINPHTFLNFIFLNKFKFEQNEVPKEVLLHEEIHAKQKHSLDILFIEFMQIIFWFQPFIWFFKSRIKLNHEFLADQAVINAGFQPSTYQNTLLNYSSHQDYSLANAIDYSSIKKRFTVMKTQTSQTKKWLFSLLVLPILGILFFSFSEHKIVKIKKQNFNKTKSSENNYSFRNDNTFYAQINGEQINGVGTKLSVEQIKKLKVSHKDFDIESFLIMFPDKKSHKIIGNSIDANFSENIKNLKKGEIITISEIENTGNIEITPVLIEVIDQQKTPTAKEIAAYNAWVKKINAKSTVFSTGETLLPPVDEQNLIKYAGIHNRMSAQQKKNAEEMPFPGFKHVKGTETSITNPVSILVNGENCDPCELTKDDLVNMKLTSSTGSKVNSFAIKFIGYPTQVNQGNTLNKKAKAIVSQYNENSPAQILNIKLNGSKKAFSKLILIKQQKQVSEKELKAYNAWAKKINTKNKTAESTGEYAIVKHKEVLKYKAIYDRMTKAQKSKAEAWPNFPPPPPPPPALVKAFKNGKKKTLNEIIKETPKNVKSGYEVLDNGESHYFIIYGGKKTYYNKDGYITDDKGNILPPPPPPPPAPKKIKSKGGPNPDGYVSYDEPKPRKVYISISKKGDFSIVKNEMDNTKFSPITLAEIDGLLSKLSTKELKNTFILSSYSDLKKYRGKPSSTPEYQDDIEVWLIKAELNNTEIFKEFSFPKSKNMFQLAYDNGIGDLQPHLDKLVSIFKKYDGINTTL